MKNIFNKKNVLYVLVLLLAGCQTTGYVIEESDYSVKQHRVAITAALGTIKSVSQNGRVILSYFHDKNFKGFDVTAKTKERLYTKVVILGTRRPYRVSVEVHIEQREPETKKFIDVGLDDNLGRSRAVSIKDMLNQSPDESGAFDEERPF